MAMYRKLGKATKPRRALLRNQATMLLYNGKIVTTEARAKEVKKIVEPIIALAAKEMDNYETVTVEAKVARKDKDGKRVKEVKDGKKVTVYDTVQKETVFQQWFAELSENNAFGFMDRFTGGSFENMSILALNITPYITSSIIIQLLTIAIPKFEEWQRDGEDGRKKLAALTRYITVALALIESVAMAIEDRCTGYQGLLQRTSWWC